MHKGPGYSERRAPHGKNTNDQGEINECAKSMGGGSVKSSDYSMDEGKIHGGGNSSSPGSKKKGGMTY